MRRIPWSFTTAVVSLVLIIPVGTRAQASALILIPDARNNGIGNAGVADITDPSTVWNNPANAALLRGVNLLPFYGEVRWPWGDSYYGAALNGGHAVYQGSSVSVNIGGELRYSHLAYWNDSKVETWGLTGAADLQFARNYHVALGGTWKNSSGEFIDDDFGPFPSTANNITTEANAYDVGVRLGAEFMSAADWHFVPAIGYNRRNTGEVESTSTLFGTETYDLPTTSIYGLSFATASPPQTLFGNDVPVMKLVLNLDLEDPERDNIESVISTGLEAALWQVAFLRFGMLAPGVGDSQVYTIGFGLGASLQHVRFRLDYSPVPLSVSGQEDIERDNKASILVSWVP